MRKAIALLITLLFIIAITVAIGVGLKQVKHASQSVEDESFMIESNMILDDVLRLLKDTKELDFITTRGTEEEKINALSVFLAQTAFIPFESGDIKVILELSSARSRFNPNAIVEVNGTVSQDRVEALKEYINSKRVNIEYVDFLLDSMSGIKEDGTYTTDIFNEKPYLFRNYITSSKHLEEINDSYMKTYRENTLNNLELENLFYFSKDRNSSIDVNYATKEVWEMMLGCDEIRAEQLSDEAGFYTKLDDLLLTPDEIIYLSQFKTSYLQLYLDVKVEILKDDKNAKIQFEYDMKKKRGSNFIYEL